MAVQMLLRPFAGMAARGGISSLLGQVPKGVKLDVKTNQKKISKNIKRYQSLLPRIFDKGLKQAGFQLLEIIRTLTKKGIDFRRLPFAPNSEGYIKRLQREGKKTSVDLIYENKMMGSLTPSSSVKKTGRGKVSVAFARAEERDKALFNQVLGNPKREFFGFDKRTEKIINKTFEKFVAKELRRARI